MYARFLLVSARTRRNGSSWRLHQNGTRRGNNRWARQRLDKAARPDLRRCGRRQYAQPAPRAIFRRRPSFVDDDGLAREMGRSQQRLSRARDADTHAVQRRRQQRRSDHHLPHSQRGTLVGRCAVRCRRRRLLDQRRAQSSQQRGRAPRLGPDHQDRRTRQIHGRLSYEEAVLAVHRDVLFNRGR